MKPGDIFKEITGLSKIPNSTIGIWKAVKQSERYKKILKLRKNQGDK